MTIEVLANATVALILQHTKGTKPTGGTPQTYTVYMSTVSQFKKRETASPVCLTSR